MVKNCLTIGKDLRVVRGKRHTRKRIVVAESNLCSLSARDSICLHAFWQASVVVLPFVRLALTKTSPRLSLILVLCTH
jgi:hypothetical protein